LGLFKNVQMQGAQKADERFSTAPQRPIYFVIRANSV